VCADVSGSISCAWDAEVGFATAVEVEALLEPKERGVISCREAFLDGFDQPAELALDRPPRGEGPLEPPH
jgi:hypothetical protein